MTDEQIRIADDLLKYLKEKEGYSSQDDYPAYLREKRYSDIDVWHVKSTLLESGLVTENQAGYMIRLTVEGEKASGVGFHKYLDEIANDLFLSRDANKATVSIGYWTKFNNLFVPIISAIALLVSILALLRK